MDLENIKRDIRAVTPEIFELIELRETANNSINKIMLEICKKYKVHPWQLTLIIVGLFGKHIVKEIFINKT